MPLRKRAPRETTSPDEQGKEAGDDDGGPATQMSSQGPGAGDQRTPKRDARFGWLSKGLQLGSRRASESAAGTGNVASGASKESRVKAGKRQGSSSPLSSPGRPPLSPLDLHKPLPSPPAGEEGTASNTSSGPRTLKLTRIMSTLSQEDVEKLFSGAPQFFARSEGHFTGAPHPSVAFPWDEVLAIRDLTDHAQIEDEAWRCITAWPHVTRGRTNSSGGDSDSKKQSSPQQQQSSPHQQPPPQQPQRRPHFYPRCRERPNMLSMQGLEKGTVGYQAALELGVADALQEEQWGIGSLGGNAPPITDRRAALLRPPKEGGLLRALDEAVMLEHLAKNGRRYHALQHQPRDRSAKQELYNELFTQVLYAPTAANGRAIIDMQDPFSLSVQIGALLRVLAAPNVWVDFSLVEWRIRLGQILWGSPAHDDVDDGSSIREPAAAEASTPAEAAGDLLEERYWLLLQILLACELLVRLDVITEGDEIGTANVKPAEIQKFDREASKSVKWALHVARVWLENIELVKTGGEETERRRSSSAASGALFGKPPQQMYQHSGSGGSGWIAALGKRLSISREGGHSGGGGGGSSSSSSPLHRQHLHHMHRRSSSAGPIYAMRGKHVQRQIDGLMHFAETLRWPNSEMGAPAQVIALNCRAVTDGTPLATPLATPGTADTHRTSYFDEVRKETTAASGGLAVTAPRTPSRRRKVAAAFRRSGWLSKSYLSGLVLPGEGLSHFLMATLLENDAAAISRLGSMANLCGGFVYGGASFWSTACVVGRVLAAGRGAAECVGWVSSDVVPQGVAAGWLDVAAADVPEDMQKINQKARLWSKAGVERDSTVLGDGDPGSVLPADFVIPRENPRRRPVEKNMRVVLSALKLVADESSGQPTPSTQQQPTPFTSLSSASSKAPPEILTRPAALDFAVAEGDTTHDITLNLANDVYFTTAHPCVPSKHVRILQSPSSPTIREVDTSGAGMPGKTASAVHATGHPLHKIYTYASIHLFELVLRARDSTLEQLLTSPDLAATPPDASSSSNNKPARFLVVDCITGLTTPPPQSPQPQQQPQPPPLDEASLSPLVPRPQGEIPPSPSPSAGSFAAAPPTPEPAAKKMHWETRRRQFGSDMEMLVRAVCAEKGWNALISRRRRGCLSCAVREAGALGWKVIIRVD